MDISFEDESIGDSTPNCLDINVFDVSISAMNMKPLFGKCLLLLIWFICIFELIFVFPKVITEWPSQEHADIEMKNDQMIEPLVVPTFYNHMSRLDQIYFLNFISMIRQ